MSIPRLVIVLIAMLSVMLAVVILRSEQTRIQFQLSEIDRKADALAQEIREQELELARLSSPWVIRKRLQDMRLDSRGSAASGG